MEGFTVGTLRGAVPRMRKLILRSSDDRPTASLGVEFFGALVDETDRRDLACRALLLYCCRRFRNIIIASTLL